MTQLLTQLVSDVSEEMQQTIINNPDKVYFPNFGSGDNILKNGFSLDRVMFKIPGTDFSIYWYGFLIALGILLAMIYGFRKMKSFGIDSDRATDAVIGGLVGAVLGARLYYILFNSELSMSDFFDFRNGGLAIYGGIIGALLVGGIIA
ncbi:MAG: prolipoprotein diacylglyceryl transferase, partial [Ruminococcus sp.]|nr:prolipoprotein diacylglyceryl transferase [Ruminococcus sp.]